MVNGVHHQMVSSVLLHRKWANSTKSVSALLVKAQEVYQWEEVRLN